MLTISCLCEGSNQVVESRPSPLYVLLTSDREEDRHGSGVLFVSHHPIEHPDQDKLAGLSRYDYGRRFTRFFCGRCGCHVFRKRPAYRPASADRSPEDLIGEGVALGAGPGREGISRRATPVGGRPPTINPAPPDTPLGEAQVFTEGLGEAGEDCFEVATGVISKSPDVFRDVEYLAHPTIDTIDGGLVPWLSMPWLDDRTPVRTRARVERSSQAVPAFCQCGNVQLRILRPQDAFPGGEARYPHSPYSDLMCPFLWTPQAVLDNPEDEKWYLCDGGTKYLAGACACRSCRLVTGYEMQTWAFVPRAAIQISVTSRPPASPFSEDYSAPDPASWAPLDFDELRRRPDNPLRSYESSPGTFREFCPCCGATVFWHSSARPDLIDVSVGLLHASEGSRAESLLEWWRHRCSFAECAGMDRTGWVREWAQGMIKWLEQGMVKSAEEVSS